MFKLFSSIYTDCVSFGSYFSSNAKCFFVEFFPPCPLVFGGRGFSLLFLFFVVFVVPFILLMI